MIEQVGIAVLGVTAIYMSQSKDKTVRRWAPVVGLMAQPFWFISAWQSEQWGIFVLCICYTLAWAKGLWNNFGPKKLVPVQ